MKGVTTDTNVRITVLWYILIQSKDMKAGHAMIHIYYIVAAFLRLNRLQ